MSDTTTEDPRFLGLVEMIAQGAMAALGKIAGPGGKPFPVDLDQARAMIDILDVLVQKTRGNLSERERRYLEAQLTNLRLTFVDEANRASRPADKTASPAPEASPTPEATKETKSPPAASPRETTSEGAGDGFVDRRSSASDE